MVIFHSYVSLPEGTWLEHNWLINVLNSKDSWFSWSSICSMFMWQQRITSAIAIPTNWHSVTIYLTYILTFYLEFFLIFLAFYLTYILTFYLAFCIWHFVSGNLSDISLYSNMADILAISLTLSRWARVAPHVAQTAGLARSFWRRWVSEAQILNLYPATFTW
jgi:hypothetical protein